MERKLYIKEQELNKKKQELNEKEQELANNKIINDLEYQIKLLKDKENDELKKKQSKH